jgi:periplasmic protein TonB
MNNPAPKDINRFKLSENDTLLLALFIAAVVHILFLLGVGFSVNKPGKASKPIVVTLSGNAIKKAPKQAKFFAAEHQSGQKSDPGDPGLAAAKPGVPTPETASPRKQMSGERRMNAKPVVQKVLTQVQAPAKIPITDEQTETTEEVEAEAKPKLNASALDQQIAQLGEQVLTSQQNLQNNKKKFVNSVSAHKYLAAQYAKDWEAKVERIGNLNYPEAARYKRDKQSLTMNVGIKADGSIDSIEIVSSSGNAALDEAAKRIVKMSAPFAELPYDLLQEVNVLVITRVWKFSDETGLTTR